MSRWILIANLAAAASCAFATRGPAVRAPLTGEGELLVELQPASAALHLAAISAVRDDGAESPLELGEVPADEASPSQRVLASGRLEPGAYRGLSLLREGRDEAPSASPVSFVISARHTVVLALAARAGGELAASIPPRTISSLLGLCAATGADELRVFDKRSAQVTAALPVGRAPWGIAIDALQNRAYVALSDDDVIEVLDLLSGEELGRIRLSSGAQPTELALTPDRRLLLSANAGSNNVSLLDPDSMIELARVPAGEEPGSLLLDRLGRRAYVFNRRSSNVTVIDLAARAAVATLALEAPPLRGQLDRTGARLYVASASSPFLTVFSLPDLAVKARIYVGLGISALKVDPDTDLLYVAQRAEKRLAVFDAFSLVPIDFLDTGGAVSYVAIDGAANALFLLEPERGVIAVVDLATRKRLAELEVGPDAHVLALMGERF